MQMLDRLESEILADRVSEESRRWLASCGLTVEQMQNQMDPVYTPARKSTCTTATIAACRWPLSARKGQQNGAQNTMNGATC
ncbi:rhsC in rhs element domain protein [Escherichia coli DEC13C]|nr:rhsC in rhs element domain protein [Escherichia coli DEC13C]